MSSSNDPASIIPAGLSFLAIYNPTLNQTDEGLHDQIVYYFSGAAGKSNNERHDDESLSSILHEEDNEKLRQVGLAQGIIQFASGFNSKAPVDSIETEKCRIIVSELESNWWVLSSIKFTGISRLHAGRADRGTEDNVTVEYSSRDVAPPALLAKQLLRAHQLFLLHHGESLSVVYARHDRDKFCGFLDRYWTHFLGRWDVLLHGNPSVDIYNGIKLSAGGELGIGVGEEEWGSGEREVLESLVGRTDGLVDLVASRFEHIGPEMSRDHRHKQTPVHRDDSSCMPRQPQDGLIFSGVGAISRESIRNLSVWLEKIASEGSKTYGIRDIASSDARRKRVQGIRTVDVREKLHMRSRPKSLVKDDTFKPPPIPAPLIMVRESSQEQTKSTKASNNLARPPDGMNTPSGYVNSDVVKYLTLGVYGSSWGLPGGRPASQLPGLKSESLLQHKPKDDPPNMQNFKQPDAYYLIGLLGNLEEPDLPEDTDAEIPSPEYNERISMRNVWVQRNQTIGKQESANYARLRVLIYVQKPFVFAFVFEPQTDSLSMPAFYRSLYHQLGPLQKHLLGSTDPASISERLSDAAATKSTVSGNSAEPIRDLVYDPVRLTVHTTIPNIPELGIDILSTTAWTRAEALTTHLHILNIFIATRQQKFELEQTSKTNRGWWIVWMRLPYENLQPADAGFVLREAILVRKATDHAPPRSRASGFGLGSLGLNSSPRGASDKNAWMPAKIVEGIGIDARQYIEGLLSLNR